MPNRRRWIRSVPLFLLLLPFALAAQERDGCQQGVPTRIWVDSGHPWRPPFGLERVGALPIVHVEVAADSTMNRTHFVVSYRKGREVEREPVDLHRDPPPGQKTTTYVESPFFGSAKLSSIPDEVALHARCTGEERTEEVLRQPVHWPAFEAEAAAAPDRRIHPVDLGAILVPHDWLLLAGGQQAVVDVAALSRNRTIRGARVRAWFDAGPPTEVRVTLTQNRRVTRRLRLPLTSSQSRGTLHIRILDGDREVWSKEITTMIVAQPPKWPAFGAVETKLRYDAPILVNDPETGARREPIDYDTAWDPRLNDVVVFLPNGSRFVFWRGSSYVPFWAGLHNTGVSYQWAENLSHPVPHPDGTQDFREPMFDSDLRFGRVEIVESTPARVHVRWTYQLTDLRHSVLGDQASEDFYFYPDGFGTRVMTLSSVPGEKYQLTEFIVLTPQSALPLEVLPGHVADVLFLDGSVEHVTLPLPPQGGPTGPSMRAVASPRDTPMVVRLFAHEKETAAAIYFDPHEPTPPMAFWPFYDRGDQVTPTYWGSHWPLTRGKWTGWTIDDRIHSAPAHNSAITFGFEFPRPLSAGEVEMPDSLGRTRKSLVQKWATLIAMTEAEDEVLVDWARSFSAPPSLTAQGARVGFPSYSQERRAIRLVVESPRVDVELRPVARTVNPVFELEGAPENLHSVVIDGRALPQQAYAWDGSTLWLNTSAGREGTKIQLQFE